MATEAELPFSLQQGETIEYEVRPNKRGFILQRFIGVVIAGIIIAVFSSLLLATGTPPLPTPYILISFFGIMVTVILIGIFVSIVSYNKYRYWITNNRLISGRGIIGYSVDSLPLEMVQDVVMNRSIADRILGLTSLYISPIGGMIVLNNARISSVNYLRALNVDEAKKIQAVIFELRDERKKEVKTI
jgi:uncharacterized membrane protein YdbT with pleckstrin-like domain